MSAAAAVALAALFFGPAGAERWRPPELVVKEREPALSADEIRELALAYLGRPYVMGGVGSPGFDCSGFTCRVYAEAGYGIPRVSRDQARAGRSVPLDALAPGDLVFFAAEPGESRIAHVGIYLGDGELVHASTGDGRIVIAEMGASWFRDRLVSARRVLPDPGMTWTSSTAVTSSTSRPARTLELVEHTGDTVLPPMLRLPPRHAPLSFGPELAGVGRTMIGLRSALVTERGVLGLVLAPEAALRVESIALLVSIAVPVRFALGQSPSAGTFSSAGDYTRFLRSATLGLRGADLDLRLTRFGDATLLGGMVVDRLAPGTRSHGVPGLTVERTPLSFFGALRHEGLALEVIADDVVEPAILGAAFTTPIAGDLLRAGAAMATDQRAELRGGRRAIGAVEAELDVALLDSRRWSIELGAGGAMVRALDDAGFGVRGTASFEHRFGGRASAIGLDLHGGRLGARYLGSLFGPTYVAHRAASLEALEATGGRWLAGVGAHLTVGRVSLGARYEDGIGAGRHPLDRSVAAVADLAGIPLGSTRVLGLRVAWASRGLLEDAPQHVLHAGARLRLYGWLHAELYVERGERLEGGGGLTLSFAP